MKDPEWFELSVLLDKARDDFVEKHDYPSAAKMRDARDSLDVILGGLILRDAIDGDQQ